MNHVVRGSIEWAGASALHLTPAQKRFCNRAKEEIVLSQRGRKMIRAPYEDGHFPSRHYVETLSQLKEFTEDCLEVVRKGPTVIVLDTRGSSDRWLDKRRELDGRQARKNEESSGVTAILLKVLVVGNGGKFWQDYGDGPMAFINMQLIVERDMYGNPSLPRSFIELLRHRNSIIVGENVVKSLKRIENSFTPQLDEVIFVTSEDLVNRYEDKRYYWEGQSEWEFDLDPFKNRGLLSNFHRVFKGTFFRNAYEAAPALWDDISKPRISQVAHALNKVFFGEMMLRSVLNHFVKKDMSLSAMCQVYPACKKTTRKDFRMEVATEAFRDKPRIHRDRDGMPAYSSVDRAARNWWFEETVWPYTPREASSGLNRAVEDDEPGNPREEQAETRKKRRRTDPYFREQREYAVSDVSDDDDDADEALRAVRRAKARAVARGKSLAKTISADEKGRDRICDPANWARLSELAKLDEDDDPLFFATLLKNLNWQCETRAVKNLCAFYAGRESDAMKEAVLNSVAADGLFKKDGPFSAFSAMQKMELKVFHPSTLLQMSLPAWKLGEFVAKLPDICSRIDVINYLCEYYSLTYDERHMQLEACDFYCRSNRAFYLKRTDMIKKALFGVCSKCGLAPRDEYFRTDRRSYINEVIEEGRQGHISIENAVRMIKAHVGEDRWHDAKDAVAMAAPWPKVAKGLSKEYNQSGNPTTIQNCDDNLAVKVKCRLELHEFHTDVFPSILRELPEVEEMKAVMAEAEVLVILTYENKDPRAYSHDLQLVTFTAPNRPTYAYFPVSISGDPRQAIGDFLLTKTLLAKRPDTVKRYLAEPGEEVRIANGAELLMEHTGGRDEESLVDFVWSKRFCSLTVSEWMVDPLTVKQSFHVGYRMNAMRDFVGKVGVEAIKAITKVVKYE